MADSGPDISGAAVHSAVFATTHWSVVLAAGDDTSPRVQEALAKLCQCYWYPLYAYVRRQGNDVADAQELTQEFFTRLLARQDLRRADPEHGRFRSFLLIRLKHFLINEWERARAQKRGGGQRPVALDELVAEERYQREPADELTAERIYERRWALTLLDEVLTKLGEEYAEPAQARLFCRWRELLANDSEASSQAQMAVDLGMNENALKQAFFRLRRRYRELLREEIAQTVAQPGDVEDELRHLVNVLRS